MSELETTYEWVNYKSATPGKRQEILFDPQSGKIAWPWLRPHLGRRVPFSPSHSGAPWLEPIHRRDDGSNSTEPPQPGFLWCHLEGTLRYPLRKYPITPLCLLLIAEAVG